MRKLKHLFVLFLGLCAMGNLYAAKSKIQHVHPTFWWSGMHNPTLQILLHGDNIGGGEVSLANAEGIALDRVVRPENSNYLILYLNTAEAKPQTFDIEVRQGRKKLAVVPYELKQREPRVVKTFDASDVVYLLMPDRFANGTIANDVVEGMQETICDSNIPMARHGGDIEGMRQKLDYLADMGVTAIWHTPLHVNDMPDQSYHGYAITDFYQMDPRFGSNEDYRNFVKEAHDKGIKVIMDIVFNHCGSNNFLYADRPADDWFNFKSQYTQSTYKTGAVGDVHVSARDLKYMTDGWFVSAMPDFNQRNEEVMTYLIQSSIWWTEYAHLAGIRQDTYPYADLQAMAGWCKAMEAEYPGYNIVGETWINHNVGVAYWQKGSRLSAPLNTELPSVMDFPLMSLLNYACDEESNDWDRGLARIYEYISQDIVYEDPLMLLTFLTNHDTNRFAANAEQAANHNRYKQALTLLLTLRGIPQLYYGDEIGMAADKSKGDGALRQNFPGGWPGDSANAFTAEGRTDAQNELFDFTRTLLRWRKGNDAVAFGKLTHYAVRNGVYVYSREKDGRVVTVIMNGTSNDVDLDMTPYVEVMPIKATREVITGKSVTPAEKMHFKGREIVVLDYQR